MCSLETNHWMVINNIICPINSVAMRINLLTQMGLILDLDI